MQNKVVSLQEIILLSESWKAQQQTIVFTNGCFDLLHPGHVDLLSRATAFGDKLIVGLNTDSSVRKLKGPERPLYKQDERAFMLAALEVVSNVVLFDEETPKMLIEAISPHVLIKGGDYKISNIIGADFVLNSGGKVEILPLKEGFSTTNIVERIKTK